VYILLRAVWGVEQGWGALTSVVQWMRGTDPCDLEAWWAKMRGKPNLSTRSSIFLFFHQTKEVIETIKTVMAFKFEQTLIQPTKPNKGVSNGKPN